jgi:hypothetical protein
VNKRTIVTINPPNLLYNPERMMRYLLPYLFQRGKGVSIFWCFSIKLERTSLWTSETVVVERVEQLVVEVFDVRVPGGVRELALAEGLRRACLSRKHLQIEDASEIEAAFAGAFQCMFELLDSSVSLTFIEFLIGLLRLLE